jgi:hypothetical protein
MRNVPPPAEMPMQAAQQQHQPNPRRSDRPSRGARGELRDHCAGIIPSSAKTPDPARGRPLKTSRVPKEYGDEGRIVCGGCVDRHGIYGGLNTSAESLRPISMWRQPCSLPSRARERLGGAMLLDLLGPPGRCSGCWPHEGEVAGDAVAISF